MTEVRPARLEDFVGLELHPYYSAFDPGALERTKHHWENAFTCLVDGQIIFIFGWVVIWEGVIEVWNLNTPLVARYGKTYYKVLKRSMNSLKHIHRVQTTVWVNFDEAIRVNERLGFVKEGILKKFGPTKYDFYIFGRTV